MPVVSSKYVYRRYYHLLELPTPIPDVNKPLMTQSTCGLCCPHHVYGILLSRGQVANCAEEMGSPRPGLPVDWRRPPSGK